MTKSRRADADSVKGDCVFCPSQKRIALVEINPIYLTPAKKPSARMKDKKMFGTEIHQPYSSPGRNSKVSTQNRTQNPGIRSIDSDINVDQSPLIQQDTNSRSHPLRYDAAKLISWCNYD